MKKQNKILALAFLLLLVLQPVMAYEVRSTMSSFNLWDVFIEYTFGDFWMAVIIITILFCLMLMMGGISQMTTLIFGISFISSMSIGYGVSFVSVMVFAFAVVMTVSEILKWVSSAGGGG